MEKDELLKRGFKYYCMGLNSKEIGKLLDLSHRTIQGYMRQGNWKAKRKPKGITKRIKELHNIGFSYTGIAKQLNISRSTVYNHLRK